MTPRASVVIPAHDEADRIETTLTALLADAEPGEFEVVVVCNGCRDDTAARARSVPGVEVVELDVASKIAALNEADRRVRTFPRIYLDADTQLSAAGARALVAALDQPEARVAGMRAEVVLDPPTRLGRWYHGFRERLPVFADGIIGAGVFALDRVGRARFADWPDVLGDDQFVLRTFPPHERAFVATHRTRVTVPGRLRAIVRRGVRVRRGNVELTHERHLAPPRSGAGVALRRAVTDPRAWPQAATWVLVSAWIRLRTRAGASGDWQASSRAAVSVGDAVR